MYLFDDYVWFLPHKILIFLRKIYKNRWKITQARNQNMSELEYCDTERLIAPLQALQSERTDISDHTHPTTQKSLIKFIDPVIHNFLNHSREESVLIQRESIQSQNSVIKRFVKKQRLTYEEIKMSISQKYSKIFLGYSQFWHKYTDVQRLLNCEKMISLRSSSDFELFLQEIRSIFDKNLKNELTERLTDLRKFLDDNICFGSTCHQAIKEWILLNLLISKMETLQILSPLIFRIMFIKGKIRQKTDLVEKYE